MELVPYIVHYHTIGTSIDPFGFTVTDYFPLNPTGRWMIETCPDEEGHHLFIEHTEFKFFKLIPWNVWIHEDKIEFKPKKTREIYDCETKTLDDETEDTSWLFY